MLFIIFFAEKFVVDENNNGEKIPNNGFGGCDNSSSASCVSHPALDVTFHMKKWVQNHPYLDRIAPIILFVSVIFTLFNSICVPGHFCSFGFLYRQPFRHTETASTTLFNGIKLKPACIPTNPILY